MSAAGQKVASPLVRDAKFLNKALAVAQRTAGFVLRIQPLGCAVEDIEVLAYGDSSWANRTDLRTQGGSLVMLVPPIKIDTVPGQFEHR